MEWRDQAAVVTGGARSLGRATAWLLAQRGAADERRSPLWGSMQADGQALPSGSRAERSVQSSRRQKYRGRGRRRA